MEKRVLSVSDVTMQFGGVVMMKEAMTVPVTLPMPPSTIISRKL